MYVAPLGLRCGATNQLTADGTVLIKINSAEVKTVALRKNNPDICTLSFVGRIRQLTDILMDKRASIIYHIWLDLCYIHSVLGCQSTLGVVRYNSVSSFFAQYPVFDPECSVHVCSQHMTTWLDIRSTCMQFSAPRVWRACSRSLLSPVAQKLILALHSCHVSISGPVIFLRPITTP